MTYTRNICGVIRTLQFTKRKLLSLTNLILIGIITSSFWRNKHYWSLVIDILWSISLLEKLVVMKSTSNWEKLKRPISRTFSNQMNKISQHRRGRLSRVPEQLPDFTNWCSLDAPCSLSSRLALWSSRCRMLRVLMGSLAQNFWDFQFFLLKMMYQHVAEGVVEY